MKNGMWDVNLLDLREFAPYTQSSALSYQL
jgi:hypothetical protein